MEKEYSGEMLKKLRVGKGWSQLKLGVEMGLYPSQVSRIEANKQRFSRTQALAAAYVLSVKVELFITC